MNPMNLLKLSQSRFVRILDFILPILALGVAAFYFWGKGDSGQALIWLITALVGFVLTIANITKIMHRILTRKVSNRA